MISKNGCQAMDCFHIHVTYSQAVLKHKMVSTIVDTLTPIIVSPFDDSDDDDELGVTGDSDARTPVAASLQVGLFINAHLNVCKF